VPGAPQRGFDFARELQVVLELRDAARADDARVLEVMANVYGNFRRAPGRRKNQ
jgi:hypothetical protein